MITKVLRLDTLEYTVDELAPAVEVLRAGGLVAFPTETVYGLGANAFDDSAAARIYEAKGRPSDNPLIVHIARTEDINKLAIDIPETAYKLAEVFWPGPLTIILKKNKCVPDMTTGGLDTVALRLPANKLARDLILCSGIYVAAPSANISGKPSPTKAEHVLKDMDGRIDMVLDGGRATLGLESTIVDLSGDKPMILRPGCITQNMLQNILGPIEYDPAIISPELYADIKPKAPGMKYRHYAPEGNLTIYEGNMTRVVNEINLQAEEKQLMGKRVGIIATDETKAYYSHGTIKSIGSRKDEASIAAELYNILREFDDLHTEYIYSESFIDDDLGQAIMNRLLKAAGYSLIKLDVE